MAVSEFVSLTELPFTLPSQAGRTVLVTGATSGIGLHASRHMASSGARLILGCRNIALAEEIAGKIREESGNAAVEAWELDLSSFASVRAFAARIETEAIDLDVLLHNAGISAIAGPRKLTEDGNELAVQTNHFSPFLLTHLLIPSLTRAAEKSGDARVVYVTGLIEGAKVELENLNSETDYVGGRRYVDTKMMNILIGYELGKRLKVPGLRCHVLAPGFFTTGLARDAEEGVKVWLKKLREDHAAPIETSGHSETYVACHPDCGPGSEWPRYVSPELTDWAWPDMALDEGLRRGLWEKTEGVVGLSQGERL